MVAFVGQACPSHVGALAMVWRVVGRAIPNPKHMGYALANVNREVLVLVVEALAHQVGGWTKSRRAGQCSLYFA